MPSRLRPTPWTRVPAPIFVLWEDPRNEASAQRRHAEGGVGGRGPPTLATAQPGAAIDPRQQGCGIPLRDDRWQGTIHVCVLAPHVFESKTRFNCARIARSKFAPR